MRIKKLLSIVLVSLMIIQVLPGYAAQEVTETDIPNWIVQFTSAEGEAYVDTTTFYSGKASMKLVNYTPYGYNKYMKIYQPITLTSGKTYKVRFMAKSNMGTSAYVCFGNEMRKSIFTVSNSYDWTPFEFTYTHNLSTPEINFFFSIENVTTKLWIDDIEIYEYQDDTLIGENLVANGDFEKITDDCNILGERPDDSEQQEKPAVENSISFVDASSLSSHIPVYRINNIEIDGNPQEWENISCHEEPREQSQYQILTEGITPKITADMRYAYDDNYFYLMCSVKDETHFPDSGTYWAGDSLQIAIGSESENYGIELGFMYIEETDASSVHGSSDPGIKFKGRRADGVTYYEVAVPWSLKFAQMPDDFLFCSVVNNNDGAGRAYGMEIASGIFNGKTNKEFPVMHMVAEGSEYIAFTELQEQAVCGDIVESTVYIINGGENRSFTLSGTQLADTKIDVKAGETALIKTPLNCIDVGNMEIEYTVDDNKVKTELSDYINVVPNEQIAHEMVEKHKSNLSELDELLDKCKQEKIATDYEEVYRNIIERFIGYMEEEISLDYYTYISYYDTELQKLYESSRDNINMYLSGEKTAMAVPKFITSDVSLDGQSFIGKTDTNGKIEERPVFLNGYGHWDQVKEEVDQMPDYGASFIQTDALIGTLLVEASVAKDWFQRVQFDVDAEVSLDETEAASGENSLKIVRRGPYKLNDLVFFFQEFEGKPGVTYEYGLKAKANSANSVWFGIGPAKELTRNDINGTYDWKEFKNTYTVGEDAINKMSDIYRVFPDTVSFTKEEENPRIRFMIACEGETESINIDDVYVREAGSSVNLLENSGFENGTPTYAENGYMYDDRVYAYLDDMLKRAEENNVKVDLGLCLFQINNLLIYKYYQNVDVTGLTWSLNYDILNHHDGKVLKAWEYYIRTIARLMNKYSSSHSICLSNESKYYSWNSDYSQPYWVEYLKEKYNGDISELNAVYHTDYSTFEEVIMPKTTTPDEEIGGLVVFNDWRQFNEDVFSCWHSWIASIFREEAPNVYVHAKMCANLFPSDAVYRSFLTDGTSPEKYAVWSDLNGNDAGNKIENRDITKTMMFYNLQTSIKNAPVLNSENHIMEDYNMNIEPEIADNADANLWQGSVNGMGATAVWIWDRAKGVTPNEHVYGTLILNRPDLVARIAKTNYDLNRLSYEVAALQKQKADVAMLYSVNSRAYETAAMSIMFKTYEATIFNGKKVQFIVDSQPEKLRDYDVVIVPFATNIPERTLTELKEVVKRGGKVIIIGDESLEKDDLNRTSDAATVKFIKDRAHIIPVTHNTYDMLTPLKNELKYELYKIFQDNCELNIVVKDAITGELLNDVVWQSALYDGKLLVNVCSYDYNSKGITRNAVIEINGERVQNMTELRSGNLFDEKFEVKMLVPQLFSINTDIKYFDVINHWAEPAINAVTDGKIVSGRGNGTFAPDDFVTVGEFARIICNLLELDCENAENRFDDVISTDWYSKYLNTAANAGILDGIINGRICYPKKYMTREEIADAFARAYEYKTRTYQEEKDIDFVDNASVSGKYLSGVKKAVALSLVKGYEDGEFKPEKNVTRAECCVIVMEFLNKI